MILARIARALGPEVVVPLHQRLVEMARQKGIVSGRKLRVGTAVVETSVHHPTNSGLSDGLRVLTRTMGQVEQVAGAAGEKLRDRVRSVGRLVMRIGHSVRSEQGAAQKRELYGKLLAVGGLVATQARRFSAAIRDGVKRSSAPRGQAALEQMRLRLDEMLARVEQVRRQTKRRILDGETHAPDELMSVFEPTTEVMIHEGKAGKPNEFGKMVNIQEAECQIITDDEVYEKRPDDRELLPEAVERHRQRRGSTPRLVAADFGFSSLANECEFERIGGEQVAIPNYATRDPVRRLSRRQAVL